MTSDIFEGTLSGLFPYYYYIFYKELDLLGYVRINYFRI